MSVDRRTFLERTAAATAALAWPSVPPSPRADDLAPIFTEISKSATTKPWHACRSGSDNRPSPPRTAA